MLRFSTFCSSVFRPPTGTFRGALSFFLSASSPFGGSRYMMTRDKNTNTHKPNTYADTHAKHTLTERKRERERRTCAGAAPSPSPSAAGVS